MMEMLKFHTEEMPMYEGVGARYVVIAYCGNWRDGEATSNPKLIPQLQRELRKRFLKRYAGEGAAAYVTNSPNFPKKLVAQP